MSKSEIYFDVSKTDLKKIIKAHKRFSAVKAEGSVLSLIHFKLVDDTLTIETTDGFKALITELEVLDYFKNMEFYLNTNLLSKITLLKDKILNSVRIIKKGECIEFHDLIYETVQTFKICKPEQAFPNIKSICENRPDSNFEIGVNPELIKDIASLTTKKGYLSIFLNPKEPTAAIIVNAESDLIKQKAVVMPVDLTKTKEEKEQADD